MNSGPVPTNLFDDSPDLIRVWRVHLDPTAAEFAALENLLSPAEINRADRFHFARDRRRFVVARGVLRLILGGYLQADPQGLSFHYGAHGKPSLALSGTGWRFNVSHSHEVALIAVTQQREVGVDVEFPRPLADRERLVAANFSASEAAVWHSLAAEAREAAFFTAWTRKEAFLKALGGGLTIPLQSFSVSLAPDEPAALLEVNGDVAAAADWGMASVPVGAGYFGALVGEGAGWRSDCVDWVANP